MLNMFNCLQDRHMIKTANSQSRVLFSFYPKQQKPNRTAIQLEKNS